MSNIGNARAFSFAGLNGESSSPVLLCLSRVLQHLEQSHWLDRRTKSLFVEFVVFNANVNLFCVVTLILESNNVGTKASPLLPLTWVFQKSQFLIPLKDIILIQVITRNFKSQIVQGKK